MRKIEDLHPKLQSLICYLKAECEKQGLKIGISECLRTAEEQDRLYAKGRTEKGSIVTNAKGSTYSSMHQWGVAFDFYRNDGRGLYYNADGFFEKVGKIGISLGLEWGGNFKSIKDLPHFQLSDWGNTPAKLKAEYKTPENFFKTWEETAMTAIEQQKFNALVKAAEKLVKENDILKQAIGWNSENPNEPSLYSYNDENIKKYVAADGNVVLDKLIKSGKLAVDEKGAFAPMSKMALRLLIIQNR